MLSPKTKLKLRGGKIIQGKLCLWKQMECHCACVLPLSHWDRARSPQNHAFGKISEIFHTWGVKEK